ncbi:MAG: hypothetical protein D6689_06155 [Deltaproteobacteria bacterium]|nr:MAG: hypothetical protein D6689_06155 [Deltaproteobacteria bacterium]
MVGPAVAHRTVAMRFAVLAAAAAGAGCLYTDPINRPPVAEIAVVDAAAPLYVGSVLALSAHKSADPDGDPLRYEWAARYCDAQNRCDPAPFATQAAATPAFSATVGERRLIAVQLVVVDTHGAQAATSQFFAVVNRPPEVGLAAQGPGTASGGFTVGRRIALFATPTDYDDPPESLSVQWTLRPVAGSSPDRLRWERKSDVEYHLWPDATGLWEVQVDVSDGQATASATRALLVEPDRPPCIAATEPPAVADARYVVDRAAGPRRFAVLAVDDELDPYPLAPDDPDGDRGTATFRWWIAGPGTGGVRVERAGHALPAVEVDPVAYAPGDRIELRVEVADRIVRALPCDDAAPVCSIAADGCVQRVTWEVEVR